MDLSCELAANLATQLGVPDAVAISPRGSVLSRQIRLRHRHPALPQGEHSGCGVRDTNHRLRFSNVTAGIPHVQPCSLLTGEVARRIVWVRSALRQQEERLHADTIGTKEERMRLIKPIVLHCRWQVDT